MACTEAHVEAPPERCFDVLSDPRSYAYWVMGSREIRAADPEWPAVGARFDHTVGIGPLKSKDHTIVEEVERDHRLRLRAKARPFGTAFVTVTIDREGEGSRVRLEEEPADLASKLLHNRAADKVLHARNEVSIDRLKELAEGRVPIPPGELDGGSEETMQTPSRAAGFGRGVAAGLVGGVAMSGSTFAEMRLTGREPSSAPARAVKRLLAIRRLGRRGEQRTTTVAHFLVAGATGGAWGAISSGKPGRAPRASLLFGLAVAPELVVVPAMRLTGPPWRWSAADHARTAVHHAVYTAVTSWVFARLKR